jgi:hypothetical protein
MEKEELLINSLKIDLQIDLSPKIPLEKIKQALACYITHLINNHFDGLIRLLYKVDVRESRLKKLLKENSGVDAANIIAELIIERQRQKIKTRMEFKTGRMKDSDEEKW